METGVQSIFGIPYPLITAILITAILITAITYKTILLASLLHTTSFLL